MKTKCDVNSCYLCQNCSAEWSHAIAVHKKNHQVRKGQQIFAEGDAVTNVYFVYAGKVKVHKNWDEGKDLIIRFAKPGDILGHMGLGHEPIYPVTATAIEDSLICSVDAAFFEASLQVNHKLTYSLMKLFADELQESEKRMRNLVHMPVKQRIALSLLNLKRKFGVTSDGTLAISLSRQDLSSYAGVVYETLFKVMNEFQQSGWIINDGRSVRIIDEQALVLASAEKNRAGA